MSSFLSRWLRRDETILPAGHRQTHTYVIGQPGTGKSRAIESWAMQDILAGRGVGVIDPHGDLFQHLVARLSARPALWERVVVIDPTDREWTVGLDPLRAVSGFPRQRLALFLTDIIVKIWGVNVSQAPRMVWLLTNSFLALADLELSLLDLPRFLLDRPFREGLLPRLTREEVLTYFHLEYPKAEAGARQWATPVLNKIGGLLFDPDVRLMFGAARPLDFRAVLDGQRVVLANLPKGILGEGTSALLGAFIVAQIQKAALSRSDARYRPPYYLYLDEFQNYTTDNIKDILSESRKYQLSLTLAHQYLDQLSVELRDAVLNTSGTLVSFRTGYQDAFRLAKEIFPSPAAMTRTERRTRLRWLGGLPLVTLEEREQPLGWELLAQEIANLPYRQFYTRRRGVSRPSRQRTLDVPDVPFTSEQREAIAALKAASGQRYGEAKGVVRERVATRKGWATFGSGQPARDNPSSDDLPLWGE